MQQRSSKMDEASTTIPEPMRDLVAQFSAVEDDTHPKKVMFIPKGCAYVVTRDAGTIITKDIGIAGYFASKPVINDADMAEILGLPQNKRAIEPDGERIVVQATDQDGNVVTEAVADHEHQGATIEALHAHGTLRFMTPLDVLARRVALNDQELRHG